MGLHVSLCHKRVEVTTDLTDATVSYLGVTLGEEAAKIKKSDRLAERSSKACNTQVISSASVWSESFQEVLLSTSKNCFNEELQNDVKESKHNRFER